MGVHLLIDAAGLEHDTVSGVRLDIARMAIVCGATAGGLDAAPAAGGTLGGEFLMPGGVMAARSLRRAVDAAYPGIVVSCAVVMDEVG